MTNALMDKELLTTRGTEYQDGYQTSWYCPECEVQIGVTFNYYPGVTKDPDESGWEEGEILYLSDCCRCGRYREGVRVGIL